jgi:hypothetical protein
MKLSGLNFARPAALMLLLSCAHGFSRDLADFEVRNPDFSRPASVDREASKPALSPITPPHRPAVPTRTPSAERVAVAPTTFRTIDARSMTMFAAPAAFRTIPVHSIIAAGAPPLVISPANRVVAAPRVAKYQRALAGADAVHVGRMPAFDRNGTARLNRFVFHRTQPAAAALPPPAVRAGGEPAGRR